MKKINTLITLLLLATSLTGCVIAVGDTEHWDDKDASQWREQAKENKRAIEGLRMGTEIGSVNAKLGAPDFSEAFTRNGEEVRIYYYRTHQRHADSKTTKDETTPLVFVDDQLVGWGETAVQQVTTN
ncbi:DUF3192 domain-containing protein [Proteobacteria bacterium 005FR1]|nr:DUF3192 domain-containing protein [Proteobacteria bacterium 005FR1]